MFHLSLPVAAFSECIAFYRDCFEADIVMLSDQAANLYVFGGQLTLHDKPGSAIRAEQRQEMHFGHVVADAEWFAIRDRVQSSAQAVLHCVEPVAEAGTRGKLLVVDPSGNIVEINSDLAVSNVKCNGFVVGGRGAEIFVEGFEWCTEVEYLARP